MGQGVGGQVGLVAILGHHHVVGLALAAGHCGVRCVGQGDELLVEGLLGRGQLLAEGFLLALELGGAGLGGLGLVLLALFHQHADFLGDTVLIGLDGVGLHLQGAALGVELQDFGYALFDILYVLNLQSGNDFLGMILDILQLQHLD